MLDDDTVVIGVTPFDAPSARLVSAVTRAGGVGVLDLGAGTGRVRSELAKLRDWSAGAWGVRITDETPSDPRLLAGADLVLADVEVLQRFPAAARPPRVFAEVVEVAGAHRAAAAGAAGLVLRGNEAGGRVSELSSFVLVQRLLAESNLELPLWVCGGIGPRTAAAVLASGATGVVLDIQLALLAEAEPSSATAARLRRLDGSESVYQDGRRFLPALSTGRPTADTGSAAAQRPAGPTTGPVAPHCHPAQCPSARTAGWPSPSRPVTAMSAPLCARCDPPPPRPHWPHPPAASPTPTVPSGHGCRSRRGR